MKITTQEIQTLKRTPNSPYEFIKPYFLFHSNKLEGSTFSEEEIATLMTSGKVEGSHDFDDVIETKNSLETLDFIVDSLGDPINKDFVIGVNTKLMKDTSKDKEGFVGHYKFLGNIIRGTQVQVALPAEVDAGMEELFEWWSASSKQLEDVIHFHVRFEHIHPFQDGNGRTGRFLMLKQCIENDIDIPIIEEQNEQQYKQWLEMAQVYGNEQPLIDVMKNCQDLFTAKLKEKKLDDLSVFVQPHQTYRLADIGKNAEAVSVAKDKQRTPNVEHTINNIK